MTNIRNYRKNSDYSALFSNGKTVVSLAVPAQNITAGNASTTYHLEQSFTLSSTPTDAIVTIKPSFSDYFPCNNISLTIPGASTSMPSEGPPRVLIEGRLSGNTLSVDVVIYISPMENIITPDFSVQFYVDSQSSPFA